MQETQTSRPGIKAFDVCRALHGDVILLCLQAVDCLMAALHLSSGLIPTDQGIGNPPLRSRLSQVQTRGIQLQSFEGWRARGSRVSHWRTSMSFRHGSSARTRPSPASKASAAALRASAAAANTRSKNGAERHVSGS
jgi:hypothetical protein